MAAGALVAELATDIAASTVTDVVGVGVLPFVHPGNTLLRWQRWSAFTASSEERLTSGLRLPPARQCRGWWLLAITAAVELVIGFWAGGSRNLSTVVLVAWVGAITLTKGTGEIVGAFELRELMRLRGVPRLVRRELRAAWGSEGGRPVDRRRLPPAPRESTPCRCGDSRR